MGCDIHGVFQRKVNDVWDDVHTKYECQRDYNLFSILAGVRGDTMPIAQPRGLPEDFYITGYQPGPESEEDPDDYGDSKYHPIKDVSYFSEWRQKCHDPKEDMLAIWMGEHSFSWLTSTEILAWRDENKTISDHGIVSRHVYEIWDKTDSPGSWCGGIWGPDIVIIEDTEEDKTRFPNWTHIRCEWNTKLTHHDYFFDEVRRLHEEHGEVRFVFGFDS